MLLNGWGGIPLEFNKMYTRQKNNDQTAEVILKIVVFIRESGLQNGRINIQFKELLPIQDPCMVYLPTFTSLNVW